MRAKNPKKNSKDLSRPSKPHNPRLPFLEHLLELRKRIFYIALSVIAWAVGAYFVQHHIVRFLLQPAADQPFIYTSVGGGIDFLVRVCIYTGIIFSIPVIVWQVLKYLQPLIKHDAVRFIAWGSVVSGILALAGMAFGYFLGLPAALHFLLNQFTTDQITPLLTIQSYMSFVSLYLFGSALLFQVPLILVLINRIKPLKPKKLLGYERWVILIAFVLGGVMNPSPRVQDQLMLAVPMILAYQVGVFLVWRMNKHGRNNGKVMTLMEKDAQARAERQAKFAQAQAELQKKMGGALPVATPVTAPAVQVPAPAVVSALPQAAAIQAGGLPESGTPAPQVPGAAAFGKPAGVRQTPVRPRGALRPTSQPLGVNRGRAFSDFSRQPRPHPQQPQTRHITIQDSPEAA
jgi:sec-independent protein translocase protein TatC